MCRMVVTIKIGIYNNKAILVGGIAVLAIGKLAKKLMTPSMLANKILSGKPRTGAKGVAIPNIPAMNAKNITNGTSGRITRLATGAIIEILPNRAMINGSVIIYAANDSIMSLAIVPSALSCFSIRGPRTNIP